MKHFRFCKADPLGEGPIDDVRIDIDMDIPKGMTLGEHNAFLTDQATQFVKTMVSSLPQGTVGRILSELMKSRVTSYQGLQKPTKV